MDGLEQHRNLKKLLLRPIAALGVSPIASATTVGCIVTSGTVLTATLGGLGYSIANGIGTPTGRTTGVISCPAVNTGSGTITNYQVLANVDYQGGPFGTTSGTEVRQLLTLVGGSLNGASVLATLSGATSYAGFTVNVASSVLNGGPVVGSSGQVLISYDVIRPNSAPSPPPTPS